MQAIRECVSARERCSEPRAGKVIMTLSVNDRARAIGTFRFIEIRLMEIVAGWTPTTPEMEVKVIFGRHIWSFAQHADWLGKRTFELRQPERYTIEPVSGYVDVLRAADEVDSTSGRLAAMYDVLIPGLETRYRDYLERTDRLIDEPSVVIIDRILADLQRQTSDAVQLRRYLTLPHWDASALLEQDRAHASVVATR